MYYHCPYKNGKTPQSTFNCISDDGLNFTKGDKYVIYPYLRKFDFNNNTYAIAMKGFYPKGSVLFKLVNNKFKEIADILPGSRHTAVLNYLNKIYVFYTIVKEAPEHIYVSELNICENDKVKIQNTKSVIKPEEYYEHKNSPLEKSNYGATYKDVRQLRDPGIFKEGKDIYLLYTVCGEQALAMCKIINL